MHRGNEAVVRRLIEEVLNRGQMGLLAELVASDHIGHDPFGDNYGPEGTRIVVAEYRAAFPDLALTIEDLLAARDTVAWRFNLRGTHAGSFMGIPPTGRVVTTPGIAIAHLAAEKVGESWVSLDALGLLRQMGAAPTVMHPARSTPTETDAVPESLVRARTRRWR